MEARVARYADVSLDASESSKSSLSASHLQILRHVLAASRQMDAVYAQQQWKGGERFLKAVREAEEVRETAFATYVEINRGPWSELDDGKSFVGEEEMTALRKCDVGVTLPPSHPPPGANFYPESWTKKEIEEWIERQENSVQDEARGFFSVLREKEGEEKELEVVPYATAYQPLLEVAAKELEQAAACAKEAGEESLASFLSLRAAAFRSNDYFDSDVAWMEVESVLHVTIGPYEVYRDKHFGYKATFEAVIGVRDKEETEKLHKLQEMMQELESNLPIDDAMKSDSVCMNTPIKVVEEVYSSGDVGGPQMIAFCLPNDERVRAAKGSKLVLLKNLSLAKHLLIMQPVAERCIRSDQVALATFDAFFTHTLCHECCHSIGPHDIRVEGKETTVRATMQELHSALEEAKADIVGLWALRYLVEKEMFGRELVEAMYVSFVVGAVRSVRFGLEEAHGRGLAMQLTYLLRHGGVAFDEQEKRLYVVFDKVAAVVEELAAKVLTIQGEGDKEAADALLREYAVITPALQHCLDHLTDVPVDIRPSYPFADSLSA